jgi:hypothetical protein
MWVRWALVTHHDVGDPFFSFRHPDNTLTLLRDTAVTQKIRRVAAMHGILPTRRFCEVVYALPRLRDPSIRFS